MAHNIRHLQLWDQWLKNSELGKALLTIENQSILRYLSNYNQNAILIGVPEQIKLFSTANFSNNWLFSPLPPKELFHNFVEAEFHRLPIKSGSIDLVILPHTLEHVDNPRKMLAEACRIVKPEGMITILGFNPHSLWGLQHLHAKHRKKHLLKNSLINSIKVKNWLRLLEFELQTYSTIHFRPAIESKKWYNRMRLIETIGPYCIPHWGGVYLLMAKAKVIPLNPIKMQWKQGLINVRIPGTITGHIARHTQ